MRKLWPLAQSAVSKDLENETKALSLDKAHLEKSKPGTEP